MVAKDRSFDIHYYEEDSKLVVIINRITVESPELVRAVCKAISELKLAGGCYIKVSGPMTDIVTMTIAHALGHKYSAVALFDPLLQKYVVCKTINPNFPLGMTIDK